MRYKMYFIYRVYVYCLLYVYWLFGRYDLYLSVKFAVKCIAINAPGEVGRNNKYDKFKIQLLNKCISNTLILFESMLIYLKISSAVSLIQKLNVLYKTWSVFLDKCRTLFIMRLYIGVQEK